MRMYKVFGTNRRGKYTWLCNMRAESAEEALKKARAHYGYLYVDGVQGYNDMCAGCEKFGKECAGTVSQSRPGCVNRR